MRDSPSSFTVHWRVKPPYLRNPSGALLLISAYHTQWNATTNHPSFDSHSRVTPRNPRRLSLFHPCHAQWKTIKNHSSFAAHLCHNVRNLNCLALFFHIQHVQWNAITGHSSFTSHSRVTLSNLRCSSRLREMSTRDSRKRLDDFRYLSNRILDRTMNLKIYSIA